MTVLIVLAAATLVVLVGRNDGSPLASLAQKTSRGAGIWAPLLVTVALPVMPALGVTGVAESLATLASGPASSDASLLAFVLAVVVTVGLSVTLSVPSSITLALVGALTGTALGRGDTVDGARVVLVLTLAAAAPVLAALLAWILGRVPFHLAQGRDGTRALSYARKAVFGALVLAYSANDGQKVLFAAALVTGTSLGHAATSPAVVAMTVLLFGTGVFLGLRASGRALRHGASSPGPLQSLWSQTSAAVVVGVGSAVGAPMSMTQSLVGGVVGAGLARGRGAVRWAPVVRIGVAWLWSLPLSCAVSYVLTRGLTHLTEG